MIDIIIPAYNGKGTIERTIASCAMQTIAKKHLNIAIVNDGSDYNYDRLVKRYSPAFKTIKAFNLEKNVGCGAARQYGIDNTSGRYIYFLDSDDTLFNAFSMQEMLMRFQSNPLLDHVYGDVFCEDKPLALRGTPNERWGQVERDVMGWLHGHIYKRSYIEKIGVKFQPYYLYEDIAWQMVAVSCTDKTERVDLPVLCHHYNSMSITRKAGTKYTNNSKCIYQIRAAVEQMVNNYPLVVKNLGCNGNERLYKIVMMEWYHFFCGYENFLKSRPWDECKEYTELVRKYYKELVSKLDMFGNPLEDEDILGWMKTSQESRNGVISPNDFNKIALEEKRLTEDELERFKNDGVWS